jgi:hypothetical protein
MDNDTISEIQNIQDGLRDLDGDLAHLDADVTAASTNIKAMINDVVSAIAGAVGEVLARRREVDKLTYALGVVIATDKELQARHGRVFNTPDHPKEEHIERRQKIKNDILALQGDLSKIEEFNNNLRSRLTRLEGR